MEKLKRSVLHTQRYTDKMFFTFFEGVQKNAYKKPCFKKCPHTDVEALRLMEFNLKTGNMIQR